METLALKMIRRKKQVLAILVTLAYFGIGLMVFAPSAAAAGTVDPNLSVLVDRAPTFFIAGLIMLGFAAVLYWLEQLEILMMVLAIIGGLLMILSIAGFLIPMVSGGGETPVCPSGQVWNGSACVSSPNGYTAIWTGRIGTVPTNGYFSTAHDAASEFPDAPYTACASMSPAGTSMTASPGGDTSRNWADNYSNTYNSRINSVFTTAAPTSAAYYVPDCIDLDFHIVLSNPAPAIGGGLQSIPLWGKVSPSRTTGTYANGTNGDVFYSDQAAGGYLGFGLIADDATATHTTDHAYKSYVTTLYQTGQWPTTGDWIPLGVTTGNVNGDWTSVWFSLKTPGGFYDGADPNGRTVTLSIDIGTMPGNSGGYKGNVLHFTWNLIAVRV